MLSGSDIEDFLNGALQRASKTGEWQHIFFAAMQEYEHLLEPEERENFDRKIATIKLNRTKSLSATVKRWR